MQSPAVTAWLRDYAACLRGGAATLTSGDEPDAEFLAGCQKFDTDLRQIDVGLLRQTTSRGEGKVLLESLHAAQAEFEAAVRQRQEEIASHLRSVGKGRTALRGYSDAGEHQRAGPLYFEKSL